MASFVQTPGSANKSWVELCEEDDYLSSDSEGSKKTSIIKEEPMSPEVKQEPVSPKVTRGTATPKVKKEPVTPKIKTEPEEISPSSAEAAKHCQDENTPKNFSEAFKKEIKTENDLQSDKESPFSYASILKNSANKTNISPRSPRKSAEKVSADSKSVKREIQQEFLQDDLSLTHHLDVFHMQSPMKLEPVDDELASPLKGSRETRSSAKRFCPSKLSLGEEAMMPDDVLMPSPKKVTRLSSRRKREAGESPMTNKRSKNSSDGHKTPKCVVQVSSPALEFETDEQVLIRRQKQIDYGKNTVGYERYCQMVPKMKRSRRHPQTPPKNVKYSRRAWDGLVKVWRQQLHFWDPPSEGGGNIEDLDMSSMSDMSSDTSSLRGSLPATPRDRRRSSRSSRRPASSASESSNPDTSPLKND